jgi:hypothetical protein
LSFLLHYFRFPVINCVFYFSDCILQLESVLTAIKGNILHILKPISLNVHTILGVTNILIQVGDDKDEISDCFVSISLPQDGGIALYLIRSNLPGIPGTIVQSLRVCDNDGCYNRARHRVEPKRVAFLLQTWVTVD